VAQHINPAQVRNIFREFWDKTYDEIYTSMSGMADLWEGPVEGGGGQMVGVNSILGIRIFNDRIYVVQGGGLKTFIKVFTPNGMEIYDIGVRACLLTNSPRDIYGSITVINDDELIIGYLYINLTLQFSAPYGHDLSTLYKNPAAKYSVARISSTSWVTAVRDSQGWHVFLNTKANPEDCLPCQVKEDAAIGTPKFTCAEINYSQNAQVIGAYRASRSMLSSGANASISSMGGFGLMDSIPMPQTNPLDCLNTMDEYVALFNKARISPADVGNVGQKLSRNCSRVMYGNMLQTMQYKREVELEHDKYIEAFIQGTEDNSAFLTKMQALVGLITPLLGEIAGSLTDSEMTRNLFSDQIWWGPVWMVANSQEFVGTPNRVNPYTLLHTVDFNVFIQTLIAAASALGGPQSFPSLPMGWVVMSDANTAPVKYSATSMTYFRFPFSLCMSTQKLFSTGNFDFDAICDVETRPDGVIIWAWNDNSTLNNKMHTQLKCYKISNDGVHRLIDTLTIGYEMSPVDSSAKSVGIDENKTYWIVRDYYLKDSQAGGIGYVETKVDISQDMTQILGVSSVTNYSNLNEVHGKDIINSTYYSDGLLERNYEQYDLDDGFMGVPAWGNNGRQYDFVSGYSGYQIHSPDLL